MPKCGYRLYKNHEELAGTNSNLRWKDMMNTLFGMDSHRFDSIWNVLTPEKKVECRKYLLKVPAKYLVNASSREELESKGKLGLIDEIKEKGIPAPILIITSKFSTQEFGVAENHDIAGAAVLAGETEIPALVIVTTAPPKGPVVIAGQPKPEEPKVKEAPKVKETPKVKVKDKQKVKAKVPVTTKEDSKILKRLKRGRRKK